ncbi:MAG: hypothetical protein MUP85_05085 [Candidatus Lokiarchaeota archaeon]|nr:hypothetical protein [Candidatus Lokiarchaeota archaeon]
MKNWVRLNLFYLGESKKHHIFRAKRWDKSLEKILYKSLYSESYEEIGSIKEIFGPITLPFISIKTSSISNFNPENNFYIKMG